MTDCDCGRDDHRPTAPFSGNWNHVEDRAMRWVSEFHRLIGVGDRDDLAMSIMILNRWRSRERVRDAEGRLLGSDFVLLFRRRPIYRIPLSRMSHDGWVDADVAAWGGSPFGTPRQAANFFGFGEFAAPRQEHLL